MADSTYRCPVCGEEFDDVGLADRHYDDHKPSEYILSSWVVNDEVEG